MKSIILFFTHVLKRSAFRSVLRAALFAAALILPVVAFAQSSDFSAFGSASGLSTVNIAIIIARLIRVALTTIGIILVCLIIYAGFLYMFSGGEPEKTKKAKRIIQNAIIGVVIIFLSYAVTVYILNKLLGTDSSSSGISAIADRYSEPLSGSLGAGIIEDHYPARGALDVPRNTRIMIMFKEAIDPTSIIADATATDLNTDNIWMYESAAPASDSEADIAAVKLSASEVVVTHNDENTIFVFEPVDLLGNADTDTNFTVHLEPTIKKKDQTAAFSGNYAGGYEWTFEVSTEEDLTPPQVVSVRPSADTTKDRNIIISLNFNEAMDPVASTGTYASTPEVPVSGDFTNIIVTYNDDGTEITVPGTYTISNGFKTIEFTPSQACGVSDPCGSELYCLPGEQTLLVTAHAATLSDEPPQAEPVGVTFDGLVDASANSLDGDSDGEAEGRETDDYSPDIWTFNTTNDVNADVPEIDSIAPTGDGSDASYPEGTIPTGNVDPGVDVSIVFNMPMRTSTLGSSNISLWADPWYEMWFRLLSYDLTIADEVVINSEDVAYSRADISHPELVSEADGGWDYYPVITNGVQSEYQICMYPAVGPDSTGTSTCAVDADRGIPYCCNGLPSASACTATNSGYDLPDTQPPTP
jgi:hypothetical protein